MASEVLHVSVIGEQGLWILGEHCQEVFLSELSVQQESLWVLTWVHKSVYVRPNLVIPCEMAQAVHQLCKDRCVCVCVCVCVYTCV